MNHSLLQGDFQRIDIEQGTSVTIWNFKAREDYTYVSEPDNTAEHRFILLYLLEPATVSIAINNNPLKRVSSLIQNCLITNNKSFLKIAYPKGSAMQGVRIVFTAEWLKDQFLDAGIFFDVDGLLSYQFSDLFRMESEENTVVKTLFEEVESNASILIIKAHFFSLVSYMMTHLTGNKDKDKQGSCTQALAEIEKVIISSIQGKMPSIQHLASDYSMSAPTLKRHFKQAFGSSIYNYYLTKKMEFAKEMLLKTSCVNEVSFALGYESVSHFTAIFKKFHGYCPSKIIAYRRAEIHTI